VLTLESYRFILTFVDDVLEDLVIPVTCPARQITFGGVARSHLPLPVLTSPMYELEIHLAMIVVQRLF
jgi:hypothetical protein